MSVLNVIEAQLDNLSPADRQIGRFILDNPDEVLRLSSARLAERTGRSQSSVVKFAQKFGFSGYQEMKLAVSKARAHAWRPPGALHSTIELGDSPATVAQKMLSSKMHAMQPNTSQSRLEGQDWSQDVQTYQCATIGFLNRFLN